MTGIFSQPFGGSAAGPSGTPSPQSNSPISWNNSRWEQDGQPVAPSGSTPNWFSRFQMSPDAFKAAAGYFSKIGAPPQGTGQPQQPQNPQPNGFGGLIRGLSGLGGNQQAPQQYGGLAQVLANQPQAQNPQPLPSGPISTPAAFVSNPLGGYGQGVSPFGMFGGIR